MGLKPNHLDTMQKCVEKTKELCVVLRQAGCRIYSIECIRVLDENIGTVKLDVTLDFCHAAVGEGISQ
jgi:hypothetical protein